MPVLGVTLRPYQPSDFETLLAMDQACFPKPIAYRRRELKRYLQLETSRCTVAEYGTPVIGKQVAGFILTERNGELAHIITLDVLQPFRRLSVGSTLLESAELEAASHGAVCMYLETATTNKAAIALWKKHGYRETSTIKNYYGRGQHAFEMLKPFARKTKVKGTS